MPGAPASCAERPRVLLLCAAMHARGPLSSPTSAWKPKTSRAQSFQQMPGVRPSCMRAIVPASRHANAQAGERSLRPWRTIASNREPIQLPESESVTAAPELVSRVATQQIVTETYDDVVGE